MEEGKKKGKGRRENCVYFIKNLSLNLFLEREAFPKEIFFLLAQVFFFVKRKSVKNALPKKIILYLQ